MRQLLSLVRIGFMTHLALAILLGADAHAMTLTINGQSQARHASSGSVEVYTQVNPDVIVAGTFALDLTEMSIGVVGTFSAGSRRRTHPFFLFRLPTVANSSEILSASASLAVLSKADAPSFRLDLWGLGFSTNGSIDENWRLFADSDASPGVGIPSRVKIQNDWIGPGNSLPTVVTTGSAANTSLVTFLRSLYDAGAVGGDLAIFRLNPDVFLVPETGGTPQYRIQFDSAQIEVPAIGPGYLTALLATMLMLLAIAARRVRRVM